MFLRPSKVFPGNFPCMFAPFDCLSSFYRIYIVLISLELLRVSWIFGFYYHNVYTHHMAWLAPSHWYLIFYKVCSPTPWKFGNVLGYFVLILMVSSLPRGVWSFGGCLTEYYTGLCYFCHSVDPSVIIGNYDRPIFLCLLFWLVPDETVHKGASKC